MPGRGVVKPLLRRPFQYAAATAFLVQRPVQRLQCTSKNRPVPWIIRQQDCRGAGAGLVANAQPSDAARGGRPSKPAP